MVFHVPFHKTENVLVIGRVDFNVLETSVSFKVRLLLFKREFHFNSAFSLTCFLVSVPIV